MASRNLLLELWISWRQPSQQTELVLTFIRWRSWQASKVVVRLSLQLLSELIVQAGAGESWQGAAIGGSTSGIIAERGSTSGIIAELAAARRGMVLAWWWQPQACLHACHLLSILLSRDNSSHIPWKEREA